MVSSSGLDVCQLQTQTPGGSRLSVVEETCSPTVQLKAWHHIGITLHQHWQLLLLQHAP
jgi:hypothetical protein